MVCKPYLGTKNRSGGNCCVKKAKVEGENDRRRRQERGRMW
jgi:hypothetical protein